MSVNATSQVNNKVATRATSEQPRTTQERPAEQPAVNEPKDEYVPSDSGDSGFADIKKLNIFALSSKGDKPGAPTAFSQTVRDKFGTIDTDGDGHASEKEINTAFKDKNVKGDFAAAVATLKNKREYLQGLSNDEVGPENDGVTLKDLDQFEKLRANGDTESSYVDGKFGDAQSRIRDTKRDLFANGKPDGDALKQGSIGDCYLLAAASSKAKQDPDALKSQFKDNGDGTFTVALGDGKQTVDAPTDAEVGFGATSGKDGLWGSVLEKAYAQQQTGKKDGTEYDGIDNNFLGEGIHAVTGNGNDTDFLSTTSLDTTRNKLESAMSDKRTVTAGIRGNMPFTDANRDNGLPMGHAYTVTRFDREKDTVSLRNPWGRTEPRKSDGTPVDGTDDGIFTVPLKDFDKYYSQVAYEER